MDSRYLRDKDELKSTPDPVDTDRRALLTAGLVGGAVAATALMSAGAAQAQGAATPFWPHPKWGKDDVAGASNWITPAKVLDAVKWIKDGKVHRIGRVYDADMPKFGARVFALRIPGSPTGGPFGGNKMVYHDEFLATEIGQTGTQFDGLGHIGIQMGKDGDKNEISTTATPPRRSATPMGSRCSASRTASRSSPAAT